MEMRKKNRSAYERKQPTQQSQPVVPKLHVMRLDTRQDGGSQILPGSRQSTRITYSSVNLVQGSQQVSREKPTSVNKNNKSEYISCGFRPKLLKKSLQDNPLVLGSILKKKLRVMERHELDRYLTAVIKPQKPLI